MKKQQLSILLGIGVVLIGGVVLVWQKEINQMSHQNIQKPILSEQKQETSTDIIARNLDVSKWKTYRNEEYRFEFKYPEEMFEISFQNDDSDNQDFPKGFFLTLNLFFDINNNTVRTPILSIFFNERENDYVAATNANVRCENISIDTKNGKLCSGKNSFDEKLRNYESFKNKGVCADGSIDTSLFIELATRSVSERRFTDGISIDLHCDHKESLGAIYRSIYESLRFF